MRIMLLAATACLRIVYFFFKLFLKPQNKITLLSRQNEKPSVDFEMLIDAINQSDYDGKLAVICKKIAPSLLGKVQYAIGILVHMYHIATSKVIVIDGYNIAVSVLNHKQNQSFVQLWHALNIVKQFGCQAVDKPWGHKASVAKAMCMHKNYTHVIACSEHSGKVLCECFGATEDKVVLLPLPRIEYILKSPEKREEIEKAYPQIFNKPILVYAPTFRGEQVDLSWIGETVDFTKYNVVVKLHPSDKHGLSQKVDSRVICDGEFSSFDWMKVCDGLITDYSGMGFEAMLLSKKVYFYLYDYADYSAKNGLNLDLWNEKISPYVTESATELKNIIEKEYDFSASEEYVKKYLSVGTNDCSRRLAEFIIGLV